MFESRCSLESGLSQGTARQLFQARRMTGDPTALLVSFDDVTLVRPIDGGRFADVFLARLHDMPCAIKMLRKEVSSQARQDYENEEVIMGNLWKGGHPNVLSLYASQMVEQPNFLVLELMATTLLDLVRESDHPTPVSCPDCMTLPILFPLLSSGLVHETDSSMCWHGLPTSEQHHPLRSCGAQRLCLSQWHMQSG